MIFESYFITLIHRLDSLFSAQKVVTMLLSEDQPITDVPVSDYDSKSGGIIETLEGLLGTFRERKTTLESDNETAESYVYSNSKLERIFKKRFLTSKLLF